MSHPPTRYPELIVFKNEDANIGDIATTFKKNGSELVDPSNPLSESEQEIAQLLIDVIGDREDSSISINKLFKDFIYSDDSDPNGVNKESEIDVSVSVAKGAGVVNIAENVIFLKEGKPITLNMKHIHSSYEMMFQVKNISSDMPVYPCKKHAYVEAFPDDPAPEKTVINVLDKFRPSILPDKGHSCMILNCENMEKGDNGSCNLHIKFKCLSSCCKEWRSGWNWVISIFDGNGNLYESSYFIKVTAQPKRDYDKWLEDKRKEKQVQSDQCVSVEPPRKRARTDKLQCSENNSGSYSMPVTHPLKVVMKTPKDEEAIMHIIQKMEGEVSYITNG